MSATSAYSRDARASDRETGEPVRVVNIALLGFGRVGQAVAATIRAERETLRRAGLEMRCVQALVRDPHKRRPPHALALVTDSRRLGLAAFDLVVEAIGGVEPARTLVARALEAGVPVVTANKTLMAHHGPALTAIAARGGTRIACDAAVVAGVPFLGLLSRRPLLATARGMVGIINGTSHFVLGAVEEGARFEDAIGEAVSCGYAEADSAADIGGRDAAEKLTVLLHLAGCTNVRPDDLTTIGIDRVTPADVAGARALGGRLKPVAVVALDAAQPGAWVGPAFVPDGHPLAALSGVANALQITSARGHDLVFSGPGAGPDATAATIVDDMVEMLGRYGASMPLTSHRADLDLGQPPIGRWLLRRGSSAILTNPIAWSEARRIADGTDVFPVIEAAATSQPIPPRPMRAEGPDSAGARRSSRDVSQ